MHLYIPLWLTSSKPVRRGQLVVAYGLWTVQMEPADNFVRCTVHVHYFILKYVVENNYCRMAELTTSETSVSSSADDKKKVRRRRKIVRCCGMYSPLALNSGEHPQRQLNVINEQDSSKAATLRETRNVCRAFAMYTHIHGMKSLHRAEGQ